MEEPRAKIPEVTCIDELVEERLAMEEEANLERPSLFISLL
jgi:hypothetical protein